MSGMQGAKIYTNQETERIFNGSGSDSSEIKELTKINKRVASALENQTHYHFKTDRIIKSKGNYRKTWLNTKLAR
jgi:signal recognition particle GTPase